MALKVLELFSGLGSFSIALNSLNIPYELVGYSEIREDVTELFCAIHNEKPEDNLGDIHNVSGIGLDVDMVTFGSPCQSFTRENHKRGKQSQHGGVKGSNTKSSLMWEAVRIIGECNPKFVIWENVPDAISKKNFPNFQNYVDEMKDLGYNTYYKLINSHDLGSAQKRRRLFAVSVRIDIDNEEFEFIEEHKESKKTIDYLEKVNTPDYPKEYVLKHVVLETLEDSLKIVNGTKQGWLLAKEGDCVDVNFYSSKTRRGRVQKQACHTIQRQKTITVVENNKLRYLTLLEYWRLQELPEYLFENVRQSKLSSGKKYDIVGGTMNQYHLYCIFNSLDKAFNLREV